MFPNSKKTILKNIISSCIILLIFIGINACGKKETRLLVFSKTAGFRHESIEAGKAAIYKLGTENNYIVDTTEDANKFTEANLQKYSAVIFLNTTGDVLNLAQQNAFERYIQAGGGFVGVHAATDTEYDWAWYGRLVGAYFNGHPKIQKAKLKVTDHNHPSTEALPEVWEREDEWYNFSNVNPDLKVLASIDEKSYEGGTMKDKHPMIWYHEYDGGRAFYTELGHTKESFIEEKYLQHLLGGIKYAVGDNKLDYSKATSVAMPETNRFSKNVLASGLDEPMEIAVSNKGLIFYTQRRGKLMRYDKELKQIGFLEVEFHLGNGLIGLALDPMFDLNRQIYLFYTDKKLAHTVARFTLTPDYMFDSTTKKVLLEIPIEFESSAHTGGSLVFDKVGNLFISVGDNTVPFESNGYSPSYERAGRNTFDAQRSSANSQDLRGKVLRIHPMPNGSYSIPAGNLFPADGKQGKPEIYTMGCRNPYRISVDSKTSTLYWGEVGPDAGKDTTIGPRGYDEVNRAAKPGFYGWPYFVGDNKSYKEFDFAANTLGSKYVAKAPINNSPNNTGLKQLPAANKAWIWYPYAESKEFPMLGKAGRNAMAGPTYYFDQYKNSETKFPKYYDRKMLIYDWMRNWIMAVTSDKNGTILSIEPMFSGMQFNNIIDMQFGPDGALYLIEYGTFWYSENSDARLVKIEYSERNRPPVAAGTTADTAGSAPLKSKFFANGSYDPDGDEFIYEWRFDGKTIESRERNPTYTFTQPGIYTPSLTITDSHGKSNKQILKVIVGNSYPVMTLQTFMPNNSFFWDNTPVSYQVSITDKEDKTPDYSKLKVTLSYLPQGKDIAGIALGHQMDKSEEQNQLLDLPVFKESDCKSCHHVTKKSVGPSFTDVAKKYTNDPKAIAYLSNKIAVGGGGVWGEHAMSAHPQLTNNMIVKMAEKILALGVKDSKLTSNKPKDVFSLDMHKGKQNEGLYLLMATYTDRGGNGVLPLSTTEKRMFRAPQLLASDNDYNRNTGPIKTPQGNIYQGGISHNSYVGYKQIDLSSITSIGISANAKVVKGKIEVRLDNNDGKVIGTASVAPTGKWEDWRTSTAALIPTKGKHDVYFVFVDDLKGKMSGEASMMNLQWLYFNNKPLTK